MESIRGVCKKTNIFTKKCAATCICWVHRLGKKTGKDKISYEYSENGAFNKRDYELSHTVLMKSVQYKAITEEECRRWELYADKNGILRCGGRLQEAELPVEGNTPSIFAKNTLGNWITYSSLPYGKFSLWDCANTYTSAQCILDRTGAKYREENNT